MSVPAIAVVGYSADFAMVCRSMVTVTPFVVVVVITAGVENIVQNPCPDLDGSAVPVGIMASIGSVSGWVDNEYRSQQNK